MKNELDYSGVPPPLSVTVPMPPKTVLVTPDGRALIRLIGFVVPGMK